MAASTIVPLSGTVNGMLRGGTPPNDLCSGALVEVLDPNTTLTRMGNSANATDDAGFGAPMVWEGFTLNQCLDVTIDLCGTAPAFANTFINLKVGCPGLTNLATASSSDLTTCVDANPTVFFPNLGAGTYYFPVIGEPGSVGPYTLNITGVPCAAPPPANDDCSGAIALTPGTTCVPVLGDCNGSIDSGVPNSCSGDVSDDIWFSFQAMDTEHTIIADPSGGYDAAIELFTGTCGALISAQCEDIAFSGQPETMDITGLTIGETYYFRVYDWYAGQPPSTTIEVCVLMAGGSGPVNDLCADVPVDQLDPGSTLNYAGTTMGATSDMDAVASSTLDDLVPKPFESPEFLEALKDALAPGGLLLYNRLADNLRDQQATQLFFEQRFLPVFPQGAYLDVGGNWILLNHKEAIKQNGRVKK